MQDSSGLLSFFQTITILCGLMFSILKTIFFFFRAVRILCMIANTFIKIHRMNSTESDSMWTIDFRWLGCVNVRFISCNKYTTLVGNVVKTGGQTLVEVRDIWEIFVPSSQFAVKLKLLLKNKSQKKEKLDGYMHAWMHENKLCG